jgi:uncharacterized membrane protein
VTRLERRFPYWLLVTGSLAWLALAVLAPWARSQDLPGAGLLYAFFAPICHQLPERSFHCFGHPLAACHRCVGLYAGFSAGLLVLPYLHGLRAFLLARSRVILFFFAPLAVDVALFAWNVPMSRFATGLVAAFPVGLFVWAAAEQLSTQYFEPPQRSENELSQAR